MKNHALKSFHQPPYHFNCAQAVVYGYQAITGDQKLSVTDFKSFGGGRAPEGLCGALYAATCIVPAAVGRLKEEFAQRTGSATCKELKGSLRQPCTVCVSIAAELLQETLSTMQLK